MVNQIMAVFNAAFLACSDWFVRVFIASGASDIYFVFIFIILLVRFVLSPIVGKVTSGSDRARKTGSAEGDTDG